MRQEKDSMYIEELKLPKNVLFLYSPLVASKLNPSV